MWSPFYDFGEIEGRLYVTMRLIKGRDLHDLGEGGRLLPERAVKIIDQIAFGAACGS
jgi:serine/threonine-protein kinase